MFQIIAFILLGVAPTSAVDDGVCTDAVETIGADYDSHVWSRDGRPVAVSVHEDTCNIAWPTGWAIFHPGR